MLGLSGAPSRGGVDTTIDCVAIVMVAGQYRGFPIDPPRPEQAMNYNVLYSGDIAPEGALYARLRFHDDGLIHILKTQRGALCEALRDNTNAGRSVWQNVILPSR